MSVDLLELTPPPKHEKLTPEQAPVVQIYHPSVAEQVAASGMAVVMNSVPAVIPPELRTAYNDKLTEYKEVSEKLNKRHKFMSVAVLELTTERFMELIEELSSMLNEVDAIREHTLEEAMEGFAV